MLNPPALALAVAAARPQAVSLAALTFRSIRLHHFTNFHAAQPLFAAAGGVTGSRYVLPQGPMALYTAFDADTAHREGNQIFYQAANAAAGPALVRAGALRPDAVVLIGTHVRVSRLLDLREPAVRASLGILTLSELAGPWRFMPNAPTQLLGDTVFNDGQFEGMVYPSAQNPGHDCLVLFPARLLPPSRVDFADPVTQLTARLP
jgi:RES domain-containing protein